MIPWRAMFPPALAPDIEDKATDQGHDHAEAVEQEHKSVANCIDEILGGFRDGEIDQGTAHGQDDDDFTSHAGEAFHGVGRCLHRGQSVSEEELGVQKGRGRAVEVAATC